MLPALCVVRMSGWVAFGRLLGIGMAAIVRAIVRAIILAIVLSEVLAGCGILSRLRRLIDRLAKIRRGGVRERQGLLIVRSRVSVGRRLAVGLSLIVRVGLSHGRLHISVRHGVRIGINVRIG